MHVTLIINLTPIINCLLYNICAAKELTYFLSAFERVNKMWDLHSLLVGMLPYDSLKWIKSVQIFHLFWYVYRNHFSKDLREYFIIGQTWFSSHL